MSKKRSRVVFMFTIIMTSVLGCSTNPAGTNISGQTFSFDIPENKFRVNVPDLPQLPMRTHPLAGSRPDMRYMGEDPKSGYSISILTPTADKGMTPEQCASSSYGSLLKRYGLNEQYVVRRKNNPSTFVVLFPYKAGPLIQLKAYILSGYGGDHCIDVHISKNASTKSEEEFKNQLMGWYQSFTNASIEHY